MSEKESMKLIKSDSINYHLWKFGASFLLDAKELTKFIDRTDIESNKTDEPKKWKVWKNNRSQTALILLSSVDQTLHPNLVNCTSTKAIWNKLQAFY